MPLPNFYANMPDLAGVTGNLLSPYVYEKDSTRLRSMSAPEAREAAFAALRLALFCKGLLQVWTHIEF